MRRGATNTSPVHTIGKTKATDMGRGAGHGVWIFEGGQLINLRTYKSGALKRTITFSRGVEGVRCAIEHLWVLEAGKRSIEVTSAVDGLPLTILSFKQTSGSCKISKRKS